MPLLLWEDEAPVITLRVVCAWCSAVMVEGTPGAVTSHTICAPCAATHFPETR